MPNIFAANESQVLVDGETVEGVRAIEYRRLQTRSSVYALGSEERIGLISGPQVVEGQVIVASASPKLDGLGQAQSFQISALLVHGTTRVSVTFDECFLQEKNFKLGVGGHGESIYSFTATRVREEPA
ncbi:MAG: hypothetical protein AB7P18_22180 [Candidatus Binatia bacterium]